MRQSCKNVQQYLNTVKHKLSLVYVPEWPSTLSQLALQACARASAWREGDGDFLLAPIPTAREMEVAYLKGTAAVMLLDTQQAAVNPAWTVSTKSQFRHQ